jgi:hypothetical protein
MPVEARLILRDPEIPITVYEVDVAVFALPEAGDNWWREIFAARVTNVEDADPPRITIERDPDATHALREGLPDGAEIGANRDPETGVWEVHVEHGGALLAVAQGHDANEDVFDVVSRARTIALSP